MRRQSEIEYERAWRKANRERSKEYKRRWRLNNPEKYRESNARYREQNKEAKRAQGLVWMAVAKGTLVRPDGCEACGAHEPLDAHHADYAKPLDVRWLCRPCHGQQSWKGAA